MIQVLQLMGSPHAAILQPLSSTRYICYVQAARLLPALVRVLQGALLQPSMTLAVGSCFRPMLLPLVDSIVEQALGAQSEGGGSHAAVSVALISLLELAPHLERFACLLSLLHNGVHRSLSYKPARDRFLMPSKHSDSIR